MCGLTIEQFWSITWKDYTIYQEAYVRKELAEWQRTRRLGYIMYIANCDKKNIVSEQNWHPLANDEKEDKGLPMSNEDVKRTLSMYGKT